MKTFEKHKLYSINNILTWFGLIFVIILFGFLFRFIKLKLSFFEPGACNALLILFTLSVRAQHLLTKKFSCTECFYFLTSRNVVVILDPLFQPPGEWIENSWNIVAPFYSFGGGISKNSFLVGAYDERGTHCKNLVEIGPGVWVGCGLSLSQWELLLLFIRITLK